MLGTGHLVHRHRNSRRPAPPRCCVRGKRTRQTSLGPRNEISAQTVLPSPAAPPRHGCLRETLARREHRRRVPSEVPPAAHCLGRPPRGGQPPPRTLEPLLPSALCWGCLWGGSSNQRKSPPQARVSPSEGQEADRRDICPENRIPRMTGPRRAESGVPTRCSPAWLFELRAKSYTHQGNMTASRG